MITVITVLLVTSLFSGSFSTMPMLAFLACCVPFFVDFIISFTAVYEKITARETTTEAELSSDYEEAYQSADRLP